jgi:hypothetical protein
VWRREAEAAQDGCRKKNQMSTKMECKQVLGLRAWHTHAQWPGDASRLHACGYEWPMRSQRTSHGPLGGLLHQPPPTKRAADASRKCLLVWDFSLTDCECINGSSSYVNLEASTRNQQQPSDRCVRDQPRVPMTALQVPPSHTRAATRSTSVVQGSSAWAAGRRAHALGRRLARPTLCASCRVHIAVSLLIPASNSTWQPSCCFTSSETVEPRLTSCTIVGRKAHRHVSPRA